MTIVQELPVEFARAFFTRLPDTPADHDPLLRASVEARIERLLDAAAARIVAARPPAAHAADPPRRAEDFRHGRRMNPEALAVARKRDALDHALGGVVLAALAEPLVVEVLANPDGRLVIDRLESGRYDAGVELSAQARERVIRLVADYVGEPITRDDPGSPACSRPVSGSRGSCPRSARSRPSRSANGQR